MPRGGSRPGAGRKPGTRDKTAEAKAVVAAHAQTLPDEIKPEIRAMSPLQVMLRAMSIEANKGNWTGASQHARDAAPYCHARLANVEMNATVRRSTTDFTDAELAALAGEFGAGSGEDGAGETPGWAN